MNKIYLVYAYDMEFSSLQGAFSTKKEAIEHAQTIESDYYDGVSVWEENFPYRYKTFCDKENKGKRIYLHEFRTGKETDGEFELEETAMGAAFRKCMEEINEKKIN